MAKTIEQMYDLKQKRIAEQIKKKELHWNQQSLSILISWAINNANSFLKEKEKGTAKGFRLIQKWYPKFIDEYRNWMIENMPSEPVKLTREDFIQAKAESPAEQAKQDLAETLGAEKIKEEETEKANELASVIVEPLEEIVQSPKDQGDFYPE